MKPADVFDRDAEWADLEAFVARPGAGMRLGIVSGRRRVGKSFLLRRLAADGIYHQALEEERAPAIARVAGMVAARAGLPVNAVRFEDWLSAFDALLSRLEPTLFVIDELPYLLARSPELLTVLQRLYDDRRGGTPLRLLLCGSGLSVMSNLLTGAQPLRGRAQLDLRLQPFDYRVSRRHWGLQDHEVALAVNAIVGGAAGYLDLMEGTTPSSPGDIADWLGATLLNPSHALYREDEFLLREDPRLVDRALYQSILSVVAAGERTPSRIGARLGRDRTAMSALLATLVDAGFLRREVDVANSKGVTYLVADPVLRFGRLIINPNRAALDERRSGPVWQASQEHWHAQILGPHLEEVATTWLHRYASSDTLGGDAARIGRRVLSDRATRTKMELDAVGMDAGGRVLFVAEVKATSTLRDGADLARLERARELLGPAAVGAKLLLISRRGFTKRLRSATRDRRDVELVDLERLYEGS